MTTTRRNKMVQAGVEYVCVQSIRSAEGKLVYTKGRVYRSEADGRITGNKGETRYEIIPALLAVYFKRVK